MAVLGSGSEGDPPSAILIVDDRPEQRLALAALLGELGEEVVEAASGREALRWLLKRSFAVILLDVGMPDLDGFETAALIRQRKSCEHTPIIFVTAQGDSALAARGYSLGAVDYILSPVDPQVLKTKVSVFLELFRKTEEANRHAESLRCHANQLRRLADAAIAIHAASSLEELYKLVADTAASTIGAQQVAVTVDAPTLAVRGSKGEGARYSVLRPETTALGAIAERALVDARGAPVRVTGDPRDGSLKRLGLAEPEGAPPLRGWMAAPLSGRDGSPIGWIQLSEKHAGDFTAEDETLLVQLAEMASIAAENTLLGEIQEANQLKDQFLATLSHELRTPLQVILNWTQLLREEVAAGQQLHGLDVIERNAHAQLRLIEELLDVSRIVSGQLSLERRPLDLLAVVGSAIEDARPAAEAKDIRVELLPSESLTIVGDPNRVRQILANLFSNAIKFTLPGGRVTLSLLSRGLEAELAVCDDGQGIAVDFLPHLFERFRQGASGTTRAHGGLGIGLAIVRQLVELHGGSIEAESEGEGCGSRFLVRFPLAASEIAALAGVGEGVEAMPPIDLGGIRVLVVEDDADTRECLRLVLEKRGAEVEAVVSVEEALCALDRRLPDVVLSDLAMPEQDGFALIRRIRERPPERGGHVPAAAISAHVRAEDRARVAIAGFGVHIGKPIDPNDLARAVRTLVESADG